MDLPEFYFSFQVHSLRFLGVEVIKQQETVAYRIYSFFALLFTGVYVFVECIEVIFHRDFEMLILVCNFAITHFLGMVKILVMYANRKQIGRLLQSLHEGVFKPNEDRGGPFEKQCIADTLLKTKFLMYCYATSIFIVYNLALLTSLKSRLTLPPEGWKLSFTPISIVNTTYSPRWEIAYVYQAMGVFMITICVYTGDVTVISIIAQVGAQLKLLENSVRTYEEQAAQRQTKKAAAAEKLAMDVLEENINYHNDILDSVEAFENVCTYLVLCVFLGNLILLCLLMYFTSLLPLTSLEFVMYAAYCILVALQVFMYCWFGNEMTLANQALAIGAAETYNVDRPICHAKALILICARAQKTLCFTAGKFAPLSVETYKSILKGSFSYFMVLRRVNSE